MKICKYWDELRPTCMVECNRPCSIRKCLQLQPVSLSTVSMFFLRCWVCKNLELMYSIVCLRFRFQWITRIASTSQSHKTSEWSSSRLAVVCSHLETYIAESQPNKKAVMVVRSFHKYRTANGFDVYLWTFNSRDSISSSNGLKNYSKLSKWYVAASAN